MISELSNVVQAYAWGSRRALAELRGETTAASVPEAELWMGAHPLAPSRLLATGQTLDTAIVRAPDSLLGAAVAAEYGAKLPFLLKILAAEEPLSLQAHPTRAQAAAGFAADEAANVPLGAPHRNYKDRNHKPELLCALGEFWALCGFRDPGQTLALLDELGVQELAPYRALLADVPNEAGICEVFERLMRAPKHEQAELSSATLAACQARAKSSRFAQELAWAARVGALYPGDVGVVSALLLNLVKLEPGEAIYLPAGNLHAYLAGTGVEIMASSDNVLRGGLTPKHVDVPELLRVLDFNPLRVAPLRPSRTEAGEHVYTTPAREFRLSYYDVAGAPLEVPVSGPEIWLVTAGRIALRAAGSDSLELSGARSAFVSADTGQVQLEGTGRIFRARVAQPA